MDTDLACTQYAGRISISGIAPRGRRMIPSLSAAPSDSQETPTLERALARETLVSERQRITLVAAVFGTVLVFYAISLIWFPRGSSSLAAQIRPVGVAVSLLGLAYALAIRRLIGSWLRSDRQPPRALRFVGALVETSIPTLAIVLVGSVTSQLSAVLGPAMLFYFVFVILATLRLDFWLCAFTGLVGAIEYAAVAMVALGESDPSGLPADLTTPLPYLAKSMLILLGGIAAGYVSGRILGQIRRSFAVVEERNRVVNMFGQHVSPAVVDKLLNQDVELGGEVRHVCVMFLDIRNFTTFSESRRPEEVVEYLNRLFGFMIESVNRHQGIVNKFLGDGFMAVFGAPISNRDDCRNAIAAAREITERVESLSTRGEIPPTRIGIGLHAGTAVTGNVGSIERKEYTIIGDVVNLASRIEQLNKELGSALLVSSAVLEATSEDERGQVSEIGPIEVKGRAEPVRVFRLA